MEGEIALKKGKRMIDKKQKNTKKQKVDNKELNEELANLEKEFVSKKELPKEQDLKINTKVFENIFIANIIMVFLYLINLGALNIETAVFITDLKVFSMVLIVLTIILFEYSYRKENGNIAIHAIECLVLAIFVLCSIYLYTIYFREFDIIISLASFIFAIYYVGKSIFIYIKMKKQYLASKNDINEIIKK